MNDPAFPMNDSQTASGAPAQAAEPRKRVLWRWSIAVTVAVLTVVIWQCASAVLAATRQSNAAVQHFHQDLNAQRYDAIFSEADNAFQQSGKKEETLKFLEAVHTKLGNAQQSTLTNTTVSSTTGGTYIVTACSTRFDQGDAREQFTWTKKANRLTLHGYHIESNALILR